MKKTVFLFIASLLMISMAWGQTLLLTDDFTGTVGTNLTANGWSAHSGAGTTPMSIAAPGLVYPGYLGSDIGNATSASGNGEDVNKSFTSVNSGSIYYSFLINSAMTAAAGYVAHFMQNTTTFHGRFWVRVVSGNLNFGLAKTTAAATWDPTNYSLNTTYLIVLKYTFNDGATNNDAVYMYVNPVLGGAEPTPTISITTDTATDATSISMVGLRQYNAGQLARFDGIRVGTSWSDVGGSAGGVSAPTTQASNITYSNVQQNQMTASWTDGDGDNRVVIMNTSNSFTTPTDGTDPTANTVYGSGQQVVYNGSGSTVTVTGLNASTAYWFRVYEYNGSGTGTKYLSSAATNNPNSQTTSAPAPVITLSTASLTGFTYVLGSGPSAEQTFTVSGTNLTQNISISAPTNYEISKTSDTGYSTPLTFAHSGGTVSAQTVYVRLKSGLSIGSYNGEDITATSSGATNKTVTCSGSVSTPPSPTAPSATAASYTDYDSFTANWDSVSGATGYYLDVYTYGSGTFATDLLISEYVEGSGNNKYIEIYNGTGSTVDLSNYRLKLYSNGSGTATGLSDVALTGTLAHGACIVYKNSSASLTLPEGVTAINKSAVYFNGDDAVALVKVVNEVEEFVDIFGMIGQDPGTQWTADGGYTTLNKTLVRKSSVTEGVSVNPSGYSADDTSAFETLGTEWDVYDQDTSSYLGSHTMAGAASAEYVTGYQNRNVGNVTSYEVTGLDADTQYFYVVRAFHTYGTSGNSNEISVTTDTYDYPNGDDVIVGDNTVTVTNGNANNGTGTLPAWPNGDVTEGTYDSLILDLLGAGPWTVTILSDAYYCAYSQGAGWNLATPVSGGFEIEVDAPVKGEPLYILLSNEDPTLPVELSSFTVAMNAYNAAVLTWVTQTETGVNGFYIYRGTTDQLSEAALVSSLIPATNTSQTQVYRYSDSELFSEGTYYYWLNVNDMDGSESFHGPVTLVYETGENPTPNIPQVTELKSIYPNPFNPSANISFGLAKSSDVEFKIYNSRGQMVRNMALGVKDAGTWNLVWNGTDNNGRAVPTGIYYIQMQAGKDSFIRKAVMMK